MDKTLREILITQAESKGVCNEGHSKIEAAINIDSLIDYYLTMVNWAMENSFPTYQTIVENFSDFEYKGIFVNKTFQGEELCGLQSYVFHNCKGVVKVAMDYDQGIIPMLYIGNGCELTIGCSQSNIPAIIVPIEEFGENVLALQENENIKFKHYKYKTK